MLITTNSIPVLSTAISDVRKPMHRPAFNLVNPLRDPRWAAFVACHPDASIFHTTEWLEALLRTYRYEPLVLTTAASGEPLTNGLVVCRVRSWATASRLVSLPFSDHCQPLVNSEVELEGLLAYGASQVRHGSSRYFELRCLRPLPSALAQRTQMVAHDNYCLHSLDLTASVDELYSKLHKSCVRNKIRKAEREGIQYQHGRSEELLQSFYRLFVQTRRRHRLPPQPLHWFRNLLHALGEKATIRLASKDGKPIASIITTQFRDTAVYKYGCSDLAHQNFGGTFLLMWRAIQDAKAAGARTFDFGRSEQANHGLVTFKEHFGAAKLPLHYYRFSTCDVKELRSDWRLRWLQKACAYCPDRFLEVLGSTLYKHIG